MKDHLKKGNGSYVPACGGSFRKDQSKGIVTGLEIKSFRESSNRCSHCEKIYMKRRNEQRKAKGLPPVSTPFEGQEVA